MGVGVYGCMPSSGGGEKKCTHTRKKMSWCGCNGVSQDCHLFNSLRSASPFTVNRYFCRGWRGDWEFSYLCRNFSIMAYMNRFNQPFVISSSSSKPIYFLTIFFWNSIVQYYFVSLSKSITNQLPFLRPFSRFKRPYCCNLPMLYFTPSSVIFPIDSATSCLVAVGCAFR